MTESAKPGRPLSLEERWAIDEELIAEQPFEVDAEPRWITDGLDQYAPGPARLIFASAPRRIVSPRTNGAGQ